MTSPLGLSPFSSQQIAQLNEQHSAEVSRLDLTKEKIEAVAEWMIINVRGDGRCQTWALIAADLDLLPEKNGLSQSQTFSLNFPGGYEDISRSPDSGLKGKKDEFDQMIRSAFLESFETKTPFLPLLKELPELGIESELLLVATIIDQIGNDDDMGDPSRLFGGDMSKNDISDWPENVKKLNLVRGDVGGNRRKLLNYAKEVYSQNQEFLSSLLESILDDQPGNLVFNFAENYLPDSRYAFTILNMESKKGITTLNFKGLLTSQESRKSQRLIKSFLALAQTGSRNSGHYRLAIPVTEAIKTVYQHGLRFPEAEFFTKNPTELVWTKQQTAPTFGGGCAALASCLAVPNPYARLPMTQDLFQAGEKGDETALQSIRTAAIEKIEKRDRDFSPLISLEKNESCYVVTLFDSNGRVTNVRLQPQAPTKQPPQSQPTTLLVLSTDLSEETFQEGLKGDVPCINKIRTSAISALKGTTQSYEQEIIFEKDSKGYVVTLWTVRGDEHKVCLTPSVKQPPKGGSCSVM